MKFLLGNVTIVETKVFKNIPSTIFSINTDSFLRKARKMYAESSNQRFPLCGSDPAVGVKPATFRFQALLKAIRRPCLTTLCRGHIVGQIIRSDWSLFFSTKVFFIGLKLLKVVLYICVDVRVSIVLMYSC